MAGLVPAIHVLAVSEERKTWMPGSSPGMTGVLVSRPTNTASRSRRACRASFERKRSAPDRQRAQGRPGARCTRGLACKKHRECAHEHTGSAEAVRPSLRSGLRLTSSSPRRSGFLVTVACGYFRKLDASVEASGPHDFAVRVSAVRHRHPHVHRIPHPTSVTTAKRPSCGHGTARVMD